MRWKASLAGSFGRIGCVAKRKSCAGVCRPYDDCDLSETSFDRDDASEYPALPTSPELAAEDYCKTCNEIVLLILYYIVI